MKNHSWLQMMKQLPGKISTHLYASGHDQSNPQHVSYLRQLQKEFRQQDVLQRPLHTLKVVVFDIETTGFFPERGDTILSIGAVKTTNGNIKEEFYSLVSTEKPLAPDIKNLTGLKEEDLRQAPPIDEVLTRFFGFVRGHVLVAHHANHEKAFMQHTLWQTSRRSFTQRIIDTQFLMQLCEPHLPLVRLEECCSHCHIAVTNRHHALGDARLTAQLWAHCIKLLTHKGYENLQDIYDQLAKKA
ncbi:exonuclease domain-containing protein [Caldalkalibacillus salinus]|uniref:exonuclease domain-containing protein n=1 Tax=Caldalkalibacillus salinus TaxID=2803787 RepID=UPI00192389F5|nr:exonuclease domain-containing protein [Caldalkalibacillus salinus]